MAGRRVVALLVVALLSAGGTSCASSTTAPGPSANASRSETAGAPSSPSATAAGPRRQPLVIATAWGRPRLDLTLPEARRIVRGDGARPVVRSLAALRRRPDAVAVLPAGRLRPTVRAARVAGVDPVRRPAAYPLRTTGPAPPRPVRLTVVGDLMLTRGVADPAAALAPMTPRLRSADLAVGNLESTLSTDGAPTQGGDSFGGGPDLVPLLARAGFDAVSLANNHTGDYGVRALRQTVGRLRDSPVRAFGAGATRRQAARAAVVVRQGVRFGFVGFNAIGETPRATRTGPGALSVRMPPRTGPLVAADLRYVGRVVRRLDRRVDAVVVLPHWGTQYTHRPEPVQRRVARALVRAGADLVVGGHPHWVQGLDAVRGAHGPVPVAHSLGNLIFDMDFMTQTEQGVVLESTWWGGRLIAVDLVPYRMDAGFAPRRASRAEARDILGDVASTSTGPYAG